MKNTTCLREDEILFLSSKQKSGNKQFKSWKTPQLETQALEILNMWLLPHRLR